MRTTRDDRLRSRERGSAMVLALFMVVILSVLGLGLLMRSQLSTASAGAERTMTKTFYAADSGIHAAFSHLQVFNPCAFQFGMVDQRGSGAASVRYPIEVAVPNSNQIGTPQQAQGSEVGGSISGGGTNLVYYNYHIRASSNEPATQTFRDIEAEVSFGPSTLTIMPPCTP